MVRDFSDSCTWTPWSLFGPLTPFWGRERSDGNVVAHFFLRLCEYGKSNGARWWLSRLLYRRSIGAFNFNEHRQWSRSGGDTTPRKDTRRERWRCSAGAKEQFAVGMLLVQVVCRCQSFFGSVQSDAPVPAREPDPCGCSEVVSSVWAISVTRAHLQLLSLAVWEAQSGTARGRPSQQLDRRSTF